MFKGSMVALVTPLLDDKPDLKRLRELVEFHINAGTTALVVAGTTGESGTLTHEEKLLVIKTAIDTAKERIPIIAGTGMNATGATIQFTQCARELGIDAALIMTPAYIKPTQEGLFEHFSHIARATALPIILYNVPGRTACDLLPQTVSRLARISNIIGIKEASDDKNRLQQILENSSDNIDVYSGDDITCAQWMLNGAKGVISVTANVAPKLMSQMCSAALNGDDIECLHMHEKLLALHQLMFCESNPIPVKWALARMGLIDEELRLPMTTLTKEFHNPMEHALKSLGLL